MSKAYRNKMFTDVSFVLSDGVTIDTNMFMLAWRSPYFASMLQGQRGGSGKIVMKCDSKVFQLLLDYIREGRVDFSAMEIQSFLQLLEHARLMGLERLVGSIQEYLLFLLESSGLSTKECCTLLDFCAINRFPEIQTATRKYVDANIFSSKTHVSKLSKDALFCFLEKENRTLEEIDIFKGLVLWLENQTSPVDVKTRVALLDLVDLAAINTVDLLRVVGRSDFYEDICDAFERQMNIKHEKMYFSQNGEEKKIQNKHLSLNGKGTEMESSEGWPSSLSHSLSSLLFRKSSKKSPRIHESEGEKEEKNGKDENEYKNEQKVEDNGKNEKIENNENEYKNEQEKNDDKDKYGEEDKNEDKNEEGHRDENKEDEALEEKDITGKYEDDQILPNEALEEKDTSGKCEDYQILSDETLEEEDNAREFGDGQIGLEGALEEDDTAGNYEDQKKKVSPRLKGMIKWSKRSRSRDVLAKISAPKGWRGLGYDFSVESRNH